MKKFLFSLLCLFSFAFFAENLVTNGDFEDGAQGWRLVDGAEVLRGAGVNGNGGLKFTRTADMPYAFVTQQVTLAPESAYRLSAMVKTEGVGPKNCTIAVEYSDEKGKWLGGNYAHGLCGDTDWTNVTVNVVTPAGAVKSTVVLYIQSGASGTGYFDTVKLEPRTPEVALQMVYPVQGQSLVEPALFRFKVGILGFRALAQEFREKIRLRVFLDGKQIEQEVLFDEMGQAEFLAPEALAAGEHTIRAEVLDRQGNLLEPSVFVEESFVVPEQGAVRPAGSCVIDEFGRALVDGKPFLPIGLYMAGISEEGDLDLIEDSDYNCLMPYGSWGLTPDGKRRHVLDSVRLALDELQRRNLKIIFSVKDIYSLPRFKGTMEPIIKEYGTDDPDEIVTQIVTAFRGHPAILAWYNNDEIPLDDIEVAIRRRQLLNRLDPHHPVWGVLCDFVEAPFFGATCDVLGVDPYPIRKEKVSNQARTVQAMDAVDASGQPSWAVPQIFNWGAYEAKNNGSAFHEWIQPRPDQMRGIILLEALRGARGFVNYSFFDLKRTYMDPARFGGSLNHTREDFLWHWNEAKELATMLKNLEPWLLSKNGPARAQLAIQSGKAQAAYFQRDDKAVDEAPLVLVAGIGPENVDATLTLPPEFPPMKSVYGHAKEVSPGVWHFSGNDIWGEALLPR